MKYTVVLTLVAVLTVSTGAMANTVSVGKYSGSFTNPNIWWDETSQTNHVPTSSDLALLYTGATVTLNAGVSATVNQLYLGEWCRAGTNLPHNSVQPMVINGSLTANLTSNIGCLASGSPTEQGAMTINSGGSFRVNQGLILGGGNNGTITINNGSLYAAWAIGLGYNPWGSTHTGVGTIYLNGGSVESNQLLYQSTNDGSQIVMSGGTLKIWIYNQGLNAINNGHIVAATGKHLEYTSYAAPGGTGIIITAVPEPATMAILALGGLIFTRRKK